MGKNQKAELEKSIVEKIKAIKKNISSYKLLTKPISPDKAIGRLTRMEAIASKSINDAALKSAKNTLLKLEQALIKIHNSDFGICCECEEPIPFARLMIMPEAEFCVKCTENIKGN